jgi:hypothetical protein
MYCINSLSAFIVSPSRTTRGSFIISPYYISYCFKILIGLPGDSAGLINPAPLSFNFEFYNDMG